LKHDGFEKSNYGVWLAKRSGDVTYIRCRNADYLNGLNRLIQSIKQETVLIDIGANIGIFSLIAEKNKNITSIYSFEPSRFSCDLFQKNVRQNDSKRINLHPYAIGPATQLASLSFFEGHSGRSAIMELDGAGAETVEMINHEVLNLIFIGISSPAFVKIDVEGFELEVLKTLQKTELFDRIEHIHIELDVTAGFPDAVHALLQLASFTEVERWGDESHWDAYWVKRGTKKLNTD
jgi:FkbM family methyltransferase